MGFYTYYKIKYRDLFFDKWWSSYSAKLKDKATEELKEYYSNCLECIVAEIMNQNAVNLYNMVLSDKKCLVFFDYLTGARLKNTNKARIREYIDNMFQLGKEIV